MFTHRCKAQGGPAKCKRKNCPERQAQLADFFGTAMTSPKPPKQTVAAKPSQTRSAAIAEAVALQESVHVSQELITEGYKKWQSAWIKDEAGKPVVYLKLRIGDARTADGTILYSGVTLCDIEVAPEMKGQNAPLAAFRIVKKQYGVEQIWIGDSFSRAGYSMTQRLLAHEVATGEKTVAFEPWVRPERVHPGPDSYEFVRDWDSMEPKYRL